MSYLWYKFLDKFVSRRFIEGTMRFVGAKLGMEIVIWHPISLFFYCTIAGFAEGHSWQHVKLELQESFLVMWAVDAAIWSPIDILNFRYVPPHLQALLVSTVSLLEAVVLSSVHGQRAHGKDDPLSGEESCERGDNEEPNSSTGCGRRGETGQGSVTNVATVAKIGQL
jgi:hypothetical protein